MHRQSLLNLLTTYTPNTQDEKVFKARTINFAQQHPDCFERTLTSGHVTASCWLLSNDESHALLMHHAKLDRWFQLGGHCDGNPDVLAVAIKEAQEESGIIGIEAVSTDIFDIDIHTIPANSREGAHDHYDIRFLLKVTSNEHVKTSHESKELRWIGKHRKQLPTDNPSVVRMFDKWVSRS